MSTITTKDGNVGLFFGRRKGVGNAMTPRFLSILVLSFVFGAAAPLAPARADCFESCQNSCKDLSGNISSSACVDTCNRAYCNRPTTSYGSIAFGVTNMAEAISWGKGSAEEANRATLATCSKYGNDCKIVTSFSNSCAALAVARGGHYTTATASALNQAEENALSACKRSWGVCEIDLSTCASH
jgi:hypothetical protein